MDITLFTSLIGDLGFPIACVIGLGWFAFYMVKKTNEANQENMKQLQDRCSAREDKLYEEIKENREVNAQAIATISMYAEKLEGIQADVKEIKTDVTIIKAKNA